MSIWRRVRDAITGRFVRRSEAKQRPETTVEETVRRKTAGDVLRRQRKK